MQIAILIFSLIIIILSSNFNIYFKSVNDTYKVYIKIGIFYFLIPHHRIIKSIKEKELSKSFNEQIEDIIMAFSKRKLILHIFSHSTIEHLYIAKFSNNPYLKAYSCGLYYIIANNIRGLLHNYFRYVNEDILILKNDVCYENVDYYFHAYISIIGLISAGIKYIIKER